MKAEIVTFVRAYNYGAVLQCWALSKALEELGVACEVLDYYPAYFKKQYTLQEAAPLCRGFRDPRAWGNRLHARILAAKRCRAFDRFLRQQLPLSQKQYRSAEELKDRAPDCGCYITGSDQVWHPNLAEFDPVFFLDFPDARSKRRLSYSASFGVKAVPQKLAEEYRRRLSGYAGYCVREESGARLLKELLGQEAAVCCDPTLLVDKSRWEGLCAQNTEQQPYILVYYVNKTRKLQEQAQALAARKNRRVICVPCAMTAQILTGKADAAYGFDVRTGLDPTQLLALFAGAEYVLTNSFHGTVFSLLFQRQFLVQTELDDGKHNHRAAELLQALGVAGRELSRGLEAIDEPLPWQQIEEKRMQMKEKALAYLRRAMEWEG